MTDIKISSPNERSFGAGPQTFKSEEFYAPIVGVAVTVLGVGYSVGQYTAGATFVATLGMVGVSAISGIAAAAIYFQCMK